jgi:hypothetical protein
MSEDPRCCGSGTCIIDTAGCCWCSRLEVVRVLRYAHSARKQREHVSAAAQRIERTWGVVDSDSTISLRQTA